ncbi:HEAT repeat domain-containing protein [Halorussus salinus]|uniref:HEAT repeat domain-containing protein n=1 Tax=Halorussus salinus TaxID=1364935 RepID=UPI0010924C03|nr:HEAT repeat domain-containing protein [Halorussus salinus]
MSDTPTDRQRRTLDAVGESPSSADADDVTTLAELASHRSEDVRTDAAETLSVVAAAQPDLVADEMGPVLRTFQHGDINVRTFALDTVATLGQHSPERFAETTAITNVAQALNDRNEWIRASAAEALGDIGTESPALLADAEVVRTLARRIESEEFPDARAQMARALGRIGRTAPELIDRRDEATLERLVGEDDEIAESLRFAVDAIAEGREAASGRDSESRGAAGTAFCPDCGTEITAESVPNFCRNCGHELS